MNAVQRLNVDGSKYFFGLSYSPIPFEVSLLASFKEVKCLKNIFIKYPEREGIGNSDQISDSVSRVLD